MVSVKTNTTINSGTGLGSDTINKYNNGTLSGSLLKTDPVSLGDSPSLSIEEQIRIAEANRDGTVWRSIIFHKVMITNVTGIDELNYTNNEARQLTVTFRADYWEEDLY